MDAIARRQAEEHPEAHEGWQVRVVPLRRQMAEGSRDGVLLLSVATGLLLLIACANGFDRRDPGLFPRRSLTSSADGR